MKSETQLEELYQKYMTFTDFMLEENSPAEVAGIMMAQSLSLYKTILSPDDYLKMTDTIYNSRLKVRTFDNPGGLL